jgi:isochorismate pyruvate lyase
MLAERRRWAEKSGLDPDAIEDLYRNLVSYFVEREMQQLRKT